MLKTNVFSKLEKYSSCPTRKKLRGNHTADQRLSFRYILFGGTIPLQGKFQACGCTVRFVSELVGNPKYGFSRDAAHSMLLRVAYMKICISLTRRSLTFLCSSQSNQSH